MAKKKLLDDVLQNPSRFYRAPPDVLRDRRFADGERLEILRAWREAGPHGAVEIDAIIMELEHRLSVQNHAAE
jgi:hypothetical protein